MDTDKLLAFLYMHINNLTRDTINLLDDSHLIDFSFFIANRLHVLAANITT